MQIGGHAYVILRRKISDDARIAAGSIVFNNIKAGTTVIGNSAKKECGNWKVKMPEEGRACPIA